MPLYPGADVLVRNNLLLISAGERAPLRAIGRFTDRQFEDVNFARIEMGFHPLEVNEIVFIGRHLYTSRSRDGYSVDEMIHQIISALDEVSIAVVTPKMSCLRNRVGRQDRWGNTVFDTAVFEMTARKPRAELFSVIPKGDTNQFQRKSPP